MLQNYGGVKEALDRSLKNKWGSKNQSSEDNKATQSQNEGLNSCKSFGETVMLNVTYMLHSMQKIQLLLKERCELENLFLY